MPETKGQILIVDDSAFMRMGLRRYLELQGYEVLEAASFSEAASVLTLNNPKVSILDISIPETEQDFLEQDEGQGLRLAEVIKEKDAEAGVILLSAYLSYYAEFQSLAQRYHGLAYLFKGDNHRNELLFVIEQVQKGGTWIAPEIQNYRSQSAKVSFSTNEKLKILDVLSNFHFLSGREMEIVELVACSTDNARIAEKLNLSLNTVASHLTRIYSKVGLGENIKLSEKRLLLTKAYLLFKS